MRRSARLVDLLLAAPGAVVTFPLVVALVAVATVETRSPGLYRQVRIGRDARRFTLYKITSMRRTSAPATTITTAGDDRITRVGRQLRRFKLDELPQLWNVVAGHMSLVGPRPDVPGYADSLDGDDRVLLDIRPGITGPASLLFKHEEILLEQADDPERYNDMVIWPAKVAVNVAYARHATMTDNFWLIMMTFRSESDRLSAMLCRWDPSLVDLDVVSRLLEGQHDD